MAGIEAVIGYAVGTFQILALDWWRSRANHRRQLILLRAELRRLSTYDAKFRWTSDGPPEDNATPVPPIPTELFIKTVGEIDFSITDEHENDNSQQSLLHIADGCRLLDYYGKESQRLAAAAPGGGPDERQRFVEDAPLLAMAYDERLDQLLFTLESSLRDIERRLGMTGLWSQLNRPLGRLPAGVNPPPLVPNDPRVAEWRERQKALASEELKLGE